MAARGVPLCVLTNPVSLRYALEVREYAPFQSRIPFIYAFVPVHGPVVLHGAAGRSYASVSDYREPRRLSTFDGGPCLADQARRFAADVDAFLEPTGLLRSEANISVPAGWDTESVHVVALEWGRQSEVLLATIADGAGHSAVQVLMRLNHHW